MNPGSSPLKSNPIDQIRRQLEANLDTSSEVRAPTTPPPSPRTPRDRQDSARTEGPAPRPVARAPISSTGSRLGLQIAQMRAASGERAPQIPKAPPPPPPPMPRAAARPAPRTPAQIIGAPEHAGRSPLELMKLFAPPSAHRTLDGMALDPAYAAIFGALAEDAPENLQDILHQMVAVERLRANPDAITQGLLRGIPQGEMAAGRFAGYAVHPHDYAKEGPAEQRAARLAEQFARDGAAIRDTFAAADRGGDRARFYRAFTPRGDGACHAARMNRIYGALEALHRPDGDPFDGSRADTSAEVLQAAYQLAVARGGATEAHVRAALGARNLDPGRIDTIVAGLHAAMMLD